MGRRPWKRRDIQSSKRKSQVTPTSMSAYAMNNQCPYRAPVSSTSLEPAPPLPPGPPQQDNHLLKVVSSLFESGKYSDLVIKCQGQRWKAHRAVVCTQSRPLAAAIDGNFRESSTGEIDLEDDDPQIVGFMLEYFYKSDVSIDANIGTSENPIDLEPAPQSSAPPPSLMETRLFPRQYPGGPYISMNQMNNLVYPVSNPINNPINTSAPSLPFGYQPVVQLTQRSYPIPSHNSFGPTGFTNPFNVQPEPSFPDNPPPPVIPSVSPQNLVTLAAIYVVAEKYDVQPLKVLAKTKYESILATTWNTKEFVESLELIYDGLPEMSEPDSLRDLAIKTAAAHAKALMDREEFMDLCKERGDFATDVFKASLQQGQTAAADPFGTGGSGILMCRNDNSHAVYGIWASGTFGGPMMQRYKCMVCNSFVD